MGNWSRCPRKGKTGSWWVGVQRHLLGPGGKLPKLLVYGFPHREFTDKLLYPSGPPANHTQMWGHMYIQNGFIGTNGEAVLSTPPKPPPHCNEPCCNPSDGSCSSHGMWGRAGSTVRAGRRARRGHKAKERGW